MDKSTKQQTKEKTVFCSPRGPSHLKPLPAGPCSLGNPLVLRDSWDFCILLHRISEFLLYEVVSNYSPQGKLMPLKENCVYAEASSVLLGDYQRGKI